jgi:hypothetical protein
MALMMEAVSTSETSANVYQTTRRNNPEDSHLHTRRRENLKSHFITAVGIFNKYLDIRIINIFCTSVCLCI